MVAAIGEQILGPTDVLLSNWTVRPSSGCSVAAGVSVDGYTLTLAANPWNIVRTHNLTPGRELLFACRYTRPPTWRTCPRQTTSTTPCTAASWATRVQIPHTSSKTSLPASAWYFRARTQGVGLPRARRPAAYRGARCGGAGASARPQAARLREATWWKAAGPSEQPQQGSSAHAVGFSRSHACTHWKAAKEVILSSCGGFF